MKKSDRNSNSRGLKVKTSLSLSKTRPLRERRFKRLQKNLKSAPKPIEPSLENKARVKPVSKLETAHRHSLWFLPARIAFLLNGLYFLTFSVLSFIGLFSSYSIIKPFFTLPFETNFSSFFLLEMAAVFSFLASLLFIHAARHPQRYRWFYFLLILLILPYHFFSNLQKMQIELPPDFQNYLFFDTIVMAVLWFAYLISLYPYLKPLSGKK